jgi:hypothetical protein
MAVTRDYNKPLQEAEPYLVQVFLCSWRGTNCRIKLLDRVISQDFRLRLIGMEIQLLIPIEVIPLEIVMKVLFKRS